MSMTRRQVLAVAAAAGVAGGCEKLISQFAASVGQSVPDVVTPPQSAQVDSIHHLLNRAGFGPWPGDVERVREMGAERWIDQQLDPRSLRDDLCEVRAARCEGADARPDEAHEFPRGQLRLSMARHALLRAVYSKRQLYETMVRFWSNHLNIYVEKGECIYLKPWDDRQVIRPHAMGNFRELIRASATSGAMLVYLDGNTNRHRGPKDIPNENYARELMELHTLGVHGGYTQADVKEAARALTGWRVHGGLLKPAIHFDAVDHDDGEKRILGHVIPGGKRERDVDEVVDIVCRHPSTPTHIATKLVRRFVSDEPPATLVAAAAKVFADTDGDIRQTVRTILNSQEFKASAGMKLKSPFRFVASALRALAADTFAHADLTDYLTRLGEGVFQYPTPDGYPDKSAAWLGTLLWRWNFAFNLAGGKVASAQTALPKLCEALGASGEQLPVRLFEHLTGKAPGDDMVDILRQSLDARGKEADRQVQVAALILSSPAFQMC